MFGEQRLDPVETPEAVAQAQLLLHPGQRGTLQPVEHLRRQLVQPHQLLAEQRHQHQQQGQQDQAEQDEHHHHARGARQAARLEAIDQRIAEIGQQQGHQERHQYRLQLVDQPAEQHQGRQPQPAAGIIQHHLRPLLINP
ncbi:hypothetical protein D3C78_1394470 [compost metagenome]